jgi:predicted TIM-barrel fold metal-dependent hydrolase
MFEGIEVYCYTCGKYAVVDKSHKVEKCIYCEGSWLRNDVAVTYSYIEGDKKHSGDVDIK